MCTGTRLAGLRKDGATFPVEVGLSLVQTPAGRFTLAVVRNLTESRRHEHPAPPHIEASNCSTATL
jgi:hypothetical protein